MRFTSVVGLLLIFTQFVEAQVPMRQRVVDVVFLNDGTRLLGAVTSNKRGQPTQILLRASWLNSNAPQILEQLKKATEKTDSPNGIVELVQQHIAKLRSEPVPDENRIGYLEERLIDLNSQGGPVVDEASGLVLLSLPAKRVRRVIIQNPSKPELALIAVLNQIDRLEEIAENEVLNQLRQIPVTQLLRQLPELEPGPKSDEIAQRGFQRLLLKTDQVLGVTCRLIKQSGQYLSEKNSSAADLQALTAKMMMGQVQSQLQMLLSEDFTKPAGSTSASPNSKIAVQFPEQLPQTATVLAANENADVVEVTEMALDPARGVAQVSIGLYHQQSDNSPWKLVTVVKGQASSRDTSAQQKQKIAGDARVQQITQLFAGLGVNGGDISNAVSLGACVEIAQQRARQALQDELVSVEPGTATGLSIRQGTLGETANETQP